MNVIPKLLIHIPRMAFAFISDNNDTASNEFLPWQNMISGSLMKLFCQEKDMRTHACTSVQLLDLCRKRSINQIIPLPLIHQPLTENTHIYTYEAHYTCIMPFLWSRSEW